MKIQKIFAIIFLVVALLGFADAAYLKIQDSLNVIPPCFVATGCETVLTSKWSEIAGIPVTVLGALYYLTIIVLSAIFLITKREKALRLASWATFIGLCATLWFVSLQLFIIQSICFYCMLSAISSVTLFVVGTIYIFKFSNKQAEIPTNPLP